MTDKDAMKLALNALETLMIERGSIYEKAITALKARLADPMRAVQRLGQEIEQEPVAWYYPDGSPDQCTTNKAYAEMEPAWTPLYTHPPQRTEPKVCDSFQARDVGMQPAECAGAIRARGD